MSNVATIPASPRSGVLPLFRLESAPRRRWRGWVALVAILALLSPCILTLPVIWGATVRFVLLWQLERCGYQATIGAVQGWPLGTTRVESVELHRAGTAVAIARVEFVLNSRLAKLHRPATWLRQVRVEGLNGTLDLTPGARGTEGLRTALKETAPRWLPEDFFLTTTELTLRHGGDTVVLHDLQLAGEENAPGHFDVRQVRIAARGINATFTNWHAQTVWRNHHLSIDRLVVDDGATLTSATFDFSRLGRRRVTWEGSLHVFGGEIRGQAAADFSAPRLALELAATLHEAKLAPLAGLLGIRAPIDGRIEQASCTFRGDPEDLAGAQMWTSLRATDFHVGARRWQSLDTRAVVVNRHVELKQLDLRQDRNVLTISGECPLPDGGLASLVWTGENAWWKAAGFTCNVDARLEDLSALAGLVGGNVPLFDGRMSINGRLMAAAGSAAINGYLSVEGTRLAICGAPLDYLRSTLIFRHNAMEVADVQATHDADYLTAHGVVDLRKTPVGVEGELRTSIRDMSVYEPVLLAIPGIGDRVATVRNLSAILRLEDGQLIVDQWHGELAENLLAR